MTNHRQAERCRGSSPPRPPSAARSVRTNALRASVSAPWAASWETLDSAQTTDRFAIFVHGLRPPVAALLVVGVCSVAPDLHAGRKPTTPTHSATRRTLKPLPLLEIWAAGPRGRRWHCSPATGSPRYAAVCDPAPASSCTPSHHRHPTNRPWRILPTPPADSATTRRPAVPSDLSRNPPAACCDTTTSTPNQHGRAGSTAPEAHTRSASTPRERPPTRPRSTTPASHLTRRHKRWPPSQEEREGRGRLSESPRLEAKRRVGRWQPLLEWAAASMTPGPQCRCAGHRVKAAGTAAIASHGAAPRLGGRLD